MTIRDDLDGSLVPAVTRAALILEVLDGLEVPYLARHDGRQPVRHSSGVGRRLPAFSTATGKAALASLDDDELDRRLAGMTTLPQPTRHSHRTVDELRVDLEHIR